MGEMVKKIVFNSQTFLLQIYWVQMNERKEAGWSVCKMLLVVMIVNLIKMNLSESDVGGAERGKETKAHKDFYSQ